MHILKRLFFFLLVLVSVLLILLTLASLLYNVPLWYIKVLDFPRVQVFIALLVCLVLLLLITHKRTFLYWLLAGGLVAGILLQAIYIYPYTPLAQKTVADAALPAKADQIKISLLLANVWMKNDNAEGLLKIIHESDPDLVLAMETNKWWTDQLATLSASYPYRVIYPLDNTYGIALYSKFPLEGTELKFLNYDEVPSIHTSVRLPEGKLFKLHAVHPVPPVGSKLPEKDSGEEVALLKVGKMLSQRELPVVVAGDFNDVAWSETNRLFGIESGLGDVRVGRGLYNSFDASSPIFRWPLDHVYVSNEFSVVEVKRLSGFGSDHFPIFVRLIFEEK